MRDKGVPGNHRPTRTEIITDSKLFDYKMCNIASEKTKRNRLLLVAMLEKLIFATSMYWESVLSKKKRFCQFRFWYYQIDSTLLITLCHGDPIEYENDRVPSLQFTDYDS